jgi:hypothetical protein
MPRKKLMGCCALLVILGAISGLVSANESVIVFNGTTDLVDIGPWGSGEITISETETLGEQQTLEIVTDGYQEGGRLDLRAPLNLDAFVAEPIQTQVILLAKAAPPEQTTVYPGYGSEYGPGMPPGATYPGAMAPGGAGGMMAGAGPGKPGEPTRPGEPGMPGMGGPFGQSQQSAEPALPVDKIRVVLVSDQGHLSSGDLLLDPNLAYEGDWLRISAVLSDFRMPPELANANLVRIALTGNRKGKFYVAEVRLVQEAAPLVAEIEGAAVRTTTTAQPTEFSAKSQHEGVEASLQWDFDDLNGLSADAYGQTVSHQFPEPGYYVVTLRAFDQNGQLQPRMDTVRVKVQ